ncbi:hypothetical protein ACA910_000344 [Epithemia clementina (nom. ined.)]
MDIPYQAPVGGMKSQSDNDSSMTDENVGFNEESQEQVPLTPSIEPDSSSLERFKQRNNSYLAFFRSPVKVSRTAASSYEQRQVPTHNPNGIMVNPLGPRPDEESDENDDSKDDNVSRISGSDGENPGIRLQYSSTQSQSTASSLAPPHSLAVPVPPGIPPQIANLQIDYLMRQPRMSLGAETRRATISPRTPDSLASRLSHTSRLFGESLLSGMANEDNNTGTHRESQQRRGIGGVVSSIDAIRKRATIDSGAAAAMTAARQNEMRRYPSQHNFVRREWLDKVDSYFQIAQKHVNDLLKKRESVPLSPHTRNLQNLEYLKLQHLEKMETLLPQSEEEDDQPVFDFCLVLTPQEVYAFWAAILDFREELLGKEAVEAMERNWKVGLADTNSEQPDTSTGTPRSHKSDKEVEVGSSSTISTPRQRRSPLAMRSVNTTAQHFKPHPRRPPMHHGASTKSMTPNLMPAEGTPRLPFASPGIYSTADSTRVSVHSRLSVFDRAIGADPQSGCPATSSDDTENHGGEDLGTLYSGNIRRKWGQSQPRMVSEPNLQHGSLNYPGAMSPATMARSVTRGTALVRRPPVSQFSEPKQPSPNTGPHEIRLEDIPNQVIPRGIAARTNGMLVFLSALRRGVVLRRHRPGHEAMYCKLFSVDGGDTIQYKWVDHATAMKAFADQRQRYSKDTNFTHPIPWVQMASHEPRTGRKGSFRTADIIVVHPARHPDPRSKDGDHGSVTLRKSRSDYFEERTFTLVCRARTTSSLDESEAKWYKSEGNESHFRYLDFETATEGEYWLVFRGLLLLHRDAAVGRFAEQRAAGIGSSYCRNSCAQGDEQYKLHVDEFLEPVTAGFVEKMIVNWRGLDPKYMVGDRAPNAVPPPSDYFLGFKSPGTSIWSRLRYAGFKTQRLYAIDTNRVVLKIACPSYRLMDVAEVLRLKVKTCDGKSFAPFRQDMIDYLKPLNDPLEQGGSSSAHGEYQFSSADRQTIIDFIIRSRIRDSGAELGEATVKRSSGLDSLGRMIQARVPLHMPGKLEVLFQAWVFYWKREHWTNGRDGRSLTHEPQVAEERESFTTVSSGDSQDKAHRRNEKDKEPEIPSLFKRVCHGAFYQPLTSIEEYFGEKVAFYFAWLQHTASHLIFLTVMGLIVFLAQVCSGNWDTPLRPYFSVCVMIWTFVVLVNWRKRANFLAHEWGTMNYKEQETTRPQFHGEFVKDEITGEDILYYPKWKRWLKYCISFPVTLLFTFGTLFVILWVHANRDMQLARYLNKQSDEETFQLSFGVSAMGHTKPVVELVLTRELLFDPIFWFLVIGMPAMLGLCLPLLNYILMRISVLLNNFENYRTVSEYRSHLIIKVFSFRFVSHFAVAYYYCFVAVGSQQAIENGFLRVASAVLVYTTVARWWENILHVGFPILIQRVKMQHFGSRLSDQLREIELEEEAITRLTASNGMTAELEKRHIAVVNKRLLLDQAQDDVWNELMLPPHDSFPEYIQAVVQFTFVSCFSVVLPITPLICLINYLMSMRLDAYKLCKGRRRPLAEKTGGIGVWEHLLHIVAVISVLTNCWLVGFTSEQFIWIRDQVGEVTLFAIVVCWEHLMLLIKYIMQTTISPIHKSVRDAIKREQHDLDEQRNKSMRRRGRRSQYQRHLAAGGAVAGLAQYPTNSDDESDIASSTCTSVHSESVYKATQLPINSSLTPVFKSRESDEENVLYSA